MNPQIDNYLLEGCGRCPLGGTPQCKVHTWQEHLIRLRALVLACGLVEEYKWSQPCYTYNGRNVLIVTAFKDFASINFFKGSLLKDEHKVLSNSGGDSQSWLFFKFTNVERIIELENIIKAYIYEAIEVEKAGLKIIYKKLEDYNFPEELLSAFEQVPNFETAFRSLTPGRQKGYLLHFSQPKQSATRESRIEKCMDLIFNGKGLQDDYRAKIS